MKVGKTQVDQTWATLIIFNKSFQAESIFKLAQHVIDNYRYYSLLYNFKDFPIRNDYAFSIACHLLGGYGQRKFDIVGYNLCNCDFQTHVKQIDQNSVLVTYKKENKTDVMRIKSDVHIQDKVSLFEAIDE